MSSKENAGARSAGLPIGPKPRLRRFHQASWDEPIIFELSVPGARGVLPPLPEPEVTELVGDPAGDLPAGIGRAEPPALP
jgi:glycine dehydrogenase subunit 2